MAHLEVDEVPVWVEEVIDSVTEYVAAGPNGLEWEVHQDQKNGQTVWCAHIGPIADQTEDGEEEWDKIHVKVTYVLDNLQKLLEEVECESDEVGVGFEGAGREEPKERVRVLIQYAPLADRDDGEDDELPKPFRLSEPELKSEKKMLN